jgi:hypothetical protein
MISSASFKEFLELFGRSFLEKKQWITSHITIPFEEAWMGQSESILQK